MTSNLIKIRIAREEDYASVARLRRQTIRNVNSKDYPPKIISNWSTKVKAADLKKDSKKFKRWVALERKKIIGFCEHNFEGHITRMYVHKDFLGRGIGTHLLVIAEKSLKKLKFKEINLEATITAKDFYLAKKYRLIDKGICHSAAVYKMRKKLIAR